MAWFALGPVSWCKNQILPSGPAQIPPGEAFVGTLNAVKVTSGPFTGMAGALLTGTTAPPAPVPVTGVPAAPVLPAVATPPVPVPVVPAPPGPAPALPLGM